MTTRTKDFALRNQIQRPCVSVRANIAEGSARRSDKDFASFLNIARASASEAQSHLYVALDLNYIDQGTFSTLYRELDEVSRMLSVERTKRPLVNEVQI